MTDQQHPLAIHHLPPFVTQPGQTDVLFVIVAVMVLLIVIGLGVFYFKLHALPEHLSHGGQKVQFQIVSVLALIALFTHNHAFWIAALLLALVPIPDFTTPVASITRSLERIAASTVPRPEPVPALDEPEPPSPREAPEPAPDDHPNAKQG
jgi:hypothetical protein